MGSNATATTGDSDSNKVFGAAGTNSASFNRVTPTGGMAVDQSVSLARRSSPAFDTPPPKPPTEPVPLVVPPDALRGPAVRGGDSARLIRIVLVAVMVIAVAVAMYIFVKPQ
jgi:hypothetical protein